MSPGTGTAKLPRFIQVLLSNYFVTIFKPKMCDILFFRWYFNQNTRQCLQFTYTGIGGNENNFNSETSCAAKCPG